MNGRAAALKVLDGVINGGQSLSALLPAAKVATRPADQALLSALVYGTLREYRALHKLVSGLLRAPLPAEDCSSQLLNLGAFQLLRLQLGDHGVLNEMVNLAGRRVPRHKNLVNAILRRIQREREALRLELDRLAPLNLPPWLRRKFPQIADINRLPPPFTLRLAPGLDRDEFCARQPGARANPLHPRAVTLEPPPPLAELAEFQSGRASVQDASAQWCATLLQPQNGERILDACAAPGGKTGHLLELAPGAELLALDSDPARLERVAENLQRLGQRATLKAADARRPADWWDGQPFDAILLDAPCSGSGVLRRHPDIGFLRTALDLQQFPRVQRQLLEALWPTLKPGGRLLYSTCSILAAENEELLAAFRADHDDARAEALPIAALHLPDRNGDGFFYGLLHKC